MSMFALMESGVPEALWCAESPVTMESGQQAVSYTSGEVLEWIIGSTLFTAQTNSGSASPTDSLMGMEIDE